MTRPPLASVLVLHGSVTFRGGSADGTLRPGRRHAEGRDTCRRGSEGSPGFPLTWWRRQVGIRPVGLPRWSLQTWTMVRGLFHIPYPMGPRSSRVTPPRPYFTRHCVRREDTVLVPLSTTLLPLIFGFDVPFAH